jgi:hypothetical protein
VVEGERELVIGCDTRRYGPGDSYFIAGWRRTPCQVPVALSGDRRVCGRASIRGKVAIGNASQALDIAAAGRKATVSVFFRPQENAINLPKNGLGAR